LRLRQIRSWRLGKDECKEDSFGAVSAVALSVLVPEVAALAEDEMRDQRCEATLMLRREKRK